MQLEPPLQARQLRYLRKERRDPDAARDHQGFPRPHIQPEQVDRVGNHHLHPRHHMAVPKKRTSPPLIIAPDRDFVARGFFGVAHQGIEIQPAGAVVVHLDHNMRAARKRKQQGAIPRNKTKALDQAVDLNHLGHPNAELRAAAQRKRYTAGEDKVLAEDPLRCRSLPHMERAGWDLLN